MATVEEKLDFLLREVKQIQANQLRSSSAVDELTAWSKKADLMGTELKSDIEDLKSRMVALETLSTTAPSQVPPREEEGRAIGRSKDKQLQGGDSGGSFPYHTLGKGEYQTLKTAHFDDIPESSMARNKSSFQYQQYDPRTYKLPKIDFPKFDGDHPQVWREKCEKYFTMYSVPTHVWVPFASINFRGTAELWLQAYEAQHTIGSWAELCVAVEQKFGRDLHHNYMRELLTIKQTSDVLEYAGRFEQAKHRVLVHNRDMGDVFFVQKFIDGLKHTISSAIVLHKPRTVDAALSLALMQEELLETSFKRYHSRPGRDFTRSSHKHDQMQPSLGVHESQQEVKSTAKNDPKPKWDDKLSLLREQRQAKGLCMKCGDKWGKGHRCPK
jgi:hypothetical protein